MIAFKKDSHRDAFDEGYRHYMIGSIVNTLQDCAVNGAHYRAGWYQAKKNYIGDKA